MCVGSLSVIYLNTMRSSVELLKRLTFEFRTQPPLAAVMPAGAGQSKQLDKPASGKKNRP